MCQFLSLISSGDGKVLWFNPAQHEAKLKFRDESIVEHYDSHTSIAAYYGVDEDQWNKWEYNPFTRELKLDKQNTADDRNTVQAFIDAIEPEQWHDLSGDIESIRILLEEINHIDWFSGKGKLPEGIEMYVFDTWEAAKDAAGDTYLESVRGAVWSVAMDAVMIAARDGARNDAWSAARDTTRDTTRNAAWNAAWNAADSATESAAWDANAPRDVSRDAAWDADLYAGVCVCDGLPLAQEHIDRAHKRWQCWKAGYGVLCDINGVLYLYRKIA